MTFLRIERSVNSAGIVGTGPLRGYIRYSERLWRKSVNNEHLHEEKQNSWVQRQLSVWQSQNSNFGQFVFLLLNVMIFKNRFFNMSVNVMQGKFQ